MSKLYAYVCSKHGEITSTQQAEAIICTVKGCKRPARRRWVVAPLYHPSKGTDA